MTLDWLEDQFKNRAAVQFRIVLKEANIYIGQNSVLYRVLRDMLLAYPAHGIKAYRGLGRFRIARLGTYYKRYQ